jgi:hypothetical protein
MLTQTVRSCFATSKVAEPKNCGLRLFVSTFTWLIAGLGFSSESVAEDASFYIDGAIGSAEHVEGAALKPSDAPLMTGEADSRVPSWSVALGYQVNSNIAFELGYLDLGDVDASVADSSGATDAQAKFTLSTRGPTLSMVGTFPIGKWTPYIRAGVLFSETELKYSGSVQGAVFSDRVSDDSQAAFFGAGITFELGSRLALQADFTHVIDAAAPRFGQSDCHNLSFGLRWKF